MRDYIFYETCDLVLSHYAVRLPVPKKV